MPVTHLLGGVRPVVEIVAWVCALLSVVDCHISVLSLTSDVIVEHLPDDTVSAFDLVLIVLRAIFKIGREKSRYSSFGRALADATTTLAMTNVSWRQYTQ